MKEIIVIIVSFILVSCSEGIEYCEDHNEAEIKWINDIYNSAPEKELVPLSELSGVIQYHGADSWGWFNHTIRVIEHGKKK